MDNIFSMRLALLSRKLLKSPYDTNLYAHLERSMKQSVQIKLLFLAKKSLFLTKMNIATEKVEFLLMYCTTQITCTLII